MSRLASLFLGDTTEASGDDNRNVPPPSAYTILFVDDEVNVLKAMKRIFRQENYTILTAESGNEALEHMDKNRIHVIISDYKMPGMTGAELLKKIKEKYPRTIRIMLTGYADVNAVMGAVNEGAVYKFITKPWNDDDLRLTVSLALEQFDLLQENRKLKIDRDAQEKKIKQLSNFANTHRTQIGRMLLKKGLVKKEDIDKAKAIQTRTNKILPAILVDMGIIDDKTIMTTVQNDLGINRVYPSEFSVTKALSALIPKEICMKNILVPLKRTQGRLIVAMADPTDYLKLDDIKFIAGIPVESVIATQKEITDKISEIYGEDDDLNMAMSELDLVDPTESIEVIIEKEDEESDIEALLIEKDQPPAIRIVNAIISDAMRHNASDVHIEPKTKYLMVRYRIDGILHDKIHIPITMHPVIVSRIKIMAELDIAERRRPQDGRITVKTSSKIVDMRLSTLPTINGEKIVLRMLDRNASIKSIDELGMSGQQLETISRFLASPQGCILATGPTGSGKTSTLYSLMQHNASIQRNYTTIEDPVEYYMGMAEQVMIREKIGLTFPLILRTILRQDPDVILIGEIRDFETAEVAFHAALTGHTVLSTLHTNSSIATVTRLKDMGVKPYVISEALVGIFAQRLVRRICDNCSSDDHPDEQTLRSLRLDPQKTDFTPKKGKGCEKCNSTGYAGRVGIFEVLQINDEIKQLISKGATESELLNTAKGSGMTTLLDDGIGKIKSGLTTCEEVLRVLGPQNILEIKCPHCRTVLPEGYRFCPLCTRQIKFRCTNCNGYLDPEWKICPYCGP